MGWTKRNIEANSRVENDADVKTIIKYVNVGQSGSNGMDGADGKNAINIALDSFQGVFNGEDGRIVEEQTETVEVVGYNGVSRMDTSVGQISGAPTGMTIDISLNGDVGTKISFTATEDLEEKSGSIIIPVYINLLNPRDSSGNKDASYWDPSEFDLTQVNLTYRWTLVSDGKDGKNGEDGSTGPQGRKGSAIRGPVEWSPSDRRWCDGTGDEDFIDVIIHDSSIYYCSTGYDGQSTDSWNDVSANWTLSTQYDFVATKVFLADNAKINFATNNELYLIDSNDNITAGAAGGNGINFWAGSDIPGNAPYQVSYDGALTASNAHITGEIHATSGTFDGYIQTTLTPVTSSSITLSDKLYLACDVGGLYNTTVRLPSNASFIGKRVIITNCNFAPYTQTSIQYTTTITVDTASFNQRIGIGGNVDVDNQAGTTPANIRSFKFRGGTVELLGIPDGLVSGMTRWVLLSGHRAITSYVTM